jgi:molecular chaperone DnaK
MKLRVAVDFGTSSTCIAMSRNGQAPQIVAVDGQPLLPSSVYAAADGTLFVGQEAERQAAVDPSRFEPNPKRRIDETELLLGNTVVGVREVIRAVLARAVDEARRMAGGAPVDQLVLTHPADWGGVRARVLRRAANGLAERITLIPEPVAAAVFHAANFSVGDKPAVGGETLAVLDLGGGTVDVSVVRRDARPVPGAMPQPGQGFRVLATKGDPSFGGADVDQALLRHVGELVAGTDQDAWRKLVEGRELVDRRRRRVVWQDVRGAKETLSRHTYTDVPMPPPFADAHVTRADLERLVAGPLGRTAELTAAAISEAGLSSTALTAIFLVGGSSRIPMVARLVHERIGVVPTTLDQPETVVARGALLAVGFDGGGAPADEITKMEVTRPAVPSHDLDRTQPVGNQSRPRPVSAAGPSSGPIPVPQQPYRPQPPMPSGPQRYPVPPVAVGVAAPGIAPGRSRLPWLVGIATVLIAAVVTTVVLVLDRDTEPVQPDGPIIAQYDYRFTVPDGWKHVGGDAEQREAQIAPGGDISGGEKITVQERLLSYDSDGDRDRAFRQLRADYENAGANFSGLDESASFAGRDVVYYRERSRSSTVDWYVLFKGTAQVSIGCEYTEADQISIVRACEQVVSTMTIGK